MRGPASRRLKGALIALAILAAPGVGRAAGCLDLSADAERQFGIPPGILQSIALVESGIAGTPWPWILNAAGTPIVLPDRMTAVRATYGAMMRFGDDVAIGCMQVHMHWHERNFSSIDEVVDPPHNVLYAAAFLASLHQTYGSWVAAVEHYHASDPTAQRDYLCRVVRNRIALGYQSEAPAICGR